MIFDLIFWFDVYSGLLSSTTVYCEGPPSFIRGEGEGGWRTLSQLLTEQV